ncbi:hypothetical protein EDF46_3609 [Frondihabitans sp. PhB188]|uniref:hypothetical protein n=1 Tax=Frondihabitans sp. PhB188 TaxID=2485200 RepID=UPI000FB23C1B|nr:hypothetical protein [Frondihabitans sp. PhB188]ROQ30292.1 hypothetical protein EDF46_3609 [Frondihabitans sp. PhB188]
MTKPTTKLLLMALIGLLLMAVGIVVLVVSPSVGEAWSGLLLAVGAAAAAVGIVQAIRTRHRS